MTLNQITTQHHKDRPFRLILIERSKNQYDKYLHIFKYLDDNTYFSIIVIGQDKITERYNHKKTVEIIDKLKPF